MSDNTNIGSMSLLICLSCGLPRQSRQLKEESREVERSKRAARGVVKGSKMYFQQEGENGEIVDALANLKEYHGSWAREYDAIAPIPWLAKMRLLPAYQSAARGR